MNEHTIIVKVTGIRLEIAGKERIVPTAEVTAFLDAYLDAYHEKIHALCDACERVEAYWADATLYDGEEFEKIKQALGKARRDWLDFVQDPEGKC